MLNMHCNQILCRHQAFLEPTLHTVTHFYLRQRRYMFLPVCLSVCLSVQDYSKMHAWIWMKCYASTDVGTWTNWLTFEPDPDHRPDCFLRYRIGYVNLQPCLGCQRAALLRGILRRENPTYTYWQRAARTSRGFKMVLFTEPLKDLCRR